MKQYLQSLFIFYIYFFQNNFGLGVSHNVPRSHSLPSILSFILPLPCDLLQIKEEKKKYQVKFVLAIYLVEPAQTPSVQPL